MIDWEKHLAYNKKKREQAINNDQLHLENKRYFFSERERADFNSKYITVNSNRINSKSGRFRTWHTTKPQSIK